MPCSEFARDKGFMGNAREPLREAKSPGRGVSEYAGEVSEGGYSAVVDLCLGADGCSLFLIVVISHPVLRRALAEDRRYQHTLDWTAVPGLETRNSCLQADPSENQSHSPDRQEESLRRRPLQSPRS